MWVPIKKGNIHPILHKDNKFLSTSTFFNHVNRYKHTITRSIAILTYIPPPSVIFSSEIINNPLLTRS